MESVVRLILTLLILSASTLRVEAEQTAIVSFTFDDVPKSVATVGVPILAAYGYPATLYVTTGNTVHPGYMTWDDIASTAKLGWEIAAHTHMHDNLTTLSDAEILDDLLTSSRLFAQHGYAPRHFASPLGAYDDRVLAIIERHFDSHRTAWPVGINSERPDPYRIASFVLRKTTTIEEIKVLLKDLRNRGGWVVFQLHQVFPSEEVVDREYGTNLLAKIVEEVHAGGFQVLTVGDALQQLRKGDQ